jgi:flagellar motor switch protein FliG
MSMDKQGIRKAAILVAALDRAAADCLLDQMAPAEAQRVRDAVLELDDVDPAERRRVIDEFFRRETSNAEPRTPAVELQLQAAGRERFRTSAHGPHRREPCGQKDKEKNQRFRSLRQAKTEILLRILEGERPQMIALVLSNLNSDQAGRVLARLQAKTQVEVIRRLVDLEEADADVLYELEQALEARLGEELKSERPQAAGPSKVTGIVEAAGKHHGIQFLDNLKAQDPKLAERFAVERVDFDDLMTLDDDSLVTVLQEAGSSIVLLALIGAPDWLINRIAKRLPASEAAAFRHRLEHFGPTRLADVEEARRRIEGVAWQLAAGGRIRLPRKLTTAA